MMNRNRPTTRHIIIKMAKVKYKERIIKAKRGKQRVIYKGIFIRLSADFSAEILQARREWHDIFKMLKGETCKLGYPAKRLFRIESDKSLLYKKI